MNGKACLLFLAVSQVALHLWITCLQ